MFTEPNARPFAASPRSTDRSAVTSQQIVQSEIDAADRKIAELQSQLKQLRAYRKKRKHYMRSSSEMNQPSLLDAVRPIVAELLHDNGSMEFDALYEFVKDRLQGKRTANGLKQVVQRVLKEACVREESTGVYKPRTV